MMNLLQVVCDRWVHLLVPMGFVFGCYLDRGNDEKLTAFRNKSLLLIYVIYINIRRNHLEVKAADEL
uniref:NADH dehydrogenase [ubiquinone] 1 beta subcomplex subunit 1 n=1 Tax=Moschus moschiferus TaxID=68415 RepID=A0A8C6DDL7_MOSMO